MSKQILKYIFSLLAFLLLFFFQSCTEKKEIPLITEDLKISNFDLKDQNGNVHDLYTYGDKKAIVLFIHGNACPIVRNAIPDLKEIRTQFEEKSIQFLLLNSNLQDDQTSVLKEAEEFNIDFPILLDIAQTAAKSLKLYRTAEAIVLNPSDWKIVYRGPINDRIGYESQKNQAKNHYLADALNAHLKGESPKEKLIKSKGCLIKIRPTTGK